MGFWDKQWPHKFISNLTDLYPSRKHQLGLKSWLYILVQHLQTVWVIYYYSVICSKIVSSVLVIDYSTRTNKKFKIDCKGHGNQKRDSRVW